MNSIYGVLTITLATWRLYIFFVAESKSPNYSTLYNLNQMYLAPTTSSGFHALAIENHWLKNDFGSFINELKSSSSSNLRRLSPYQSDRFYIDYTFIHHTLLDCAHIFYILETSDETTFDPLNFFFTYVNW